METVLVVEDDRAYARITTNWLVKNGINAVMYYRWIRRRAFWKAMR